MHKNNYKITNYESFRFGSFVKIDLFYFNCLKLEMPLSHSIWFDDKKYYLK